MKSNIFILAFFSIVICTGVEAAKGAPNCAPPTYTWSLSNSTANYETNASYTRLPMGQVTYGQGPLDYPAMEFHGQTLSYADLRVEYTETFWNDAFDYSVQMYIYVANNTKGTLFHYKSDNQNLSATYIVEFVASLANGDVVLDFKTYGSYRYPTNLLNSQWYHLILERDHSNTRTFLFIDKSGIEHNYPSDIAETPTKLPGVMRIGGSLDGSKPPLDGRVACVQVVPGREPFGCVDHDVYCTTPHENLTVVPMLLRQSTNLVNLDNCMRFNTFATNASFSSQDDVISVSSVTNVTECALLCTTEAICAAFAVAQTFNGTFECTLGYHVNATSTNDAPGSDIYTVV